MNSRSAERKRRLLILRNQQVGAPGLYPRPEVDSSDDQVLVENFWIACGAQGLPRLSIGRADHSARDCFVLEKPYAVLGQAPDCDIRLADPDVSFRHAYLQLVNGRLLCIDLASNTGTYFGARPRHSAWLDAGTTASIGPYMLHYLGDQQDVFGEAESCEQTPQSDRPSLTIPNLSRSDQPHDRPEHLPNVSLVFLNARSESSQKKNRRITRSVTLAGGSRACKLMLVDETVSRVHCSFVLTPQGLWIVDLLGRGGTKVNGDIIEHQRLEDGSEISVGRFRFGVRYDTQESPQTWAVATQPLSAFPSPPADETAPDATSVMIGESAIVMADDGTAVTPATATETDSVPNPSLAEPEAAKPVAAVSVPEGAEPSGPFSEKFVLSLVEQFSVMQQQMFDQTQQQMLMLTQMFGAMYQSQQNLIREELQQIHALTTEMQHIQSRLLVEQVMTDNANSPAAQSPGVGKSKGLTAQTGPLPSDSGEDLARDQTEGEAEAAETEIVPPAAAAEPTAAAERIPDDEADSEERPPRGRADVDSHAWLAERMGQLERERSSHWKKIMQTLSGAGS